jgi:hypothetical protein
MIAGGFAITAFVLHLASVAQKERQRKRTVHPPSLTRPGTRHGIFLPPSTGLPIAFRREGGLCRAYDGVFSFN